MDKDHVIIVIYTTHSVALVCLYIIHKLKIKAAVYPIGFSQESSDLCTLVGGVFDFAHARRTSINSYLTRGKNAISLFSSCPAWAIYFV